jgi:hypothetical protein
MAEQKSWHRKSRQIEKKRQVVKKGNGLGKNGWVICLQSSAYSALGMIGWDNVESIVGRTFVDSERVLQFFVEVRNVERQNVEIQIVDLKMYNHSLT